MKYVSLSKFSEERLRKDYINQHSRFIHSSWLLLEDLDKELDILEEEQKERWGIDGKPEE